MRKAGTGGEYPDVRKMPGGEFQWCCEGTCRTVRSRKHEKSRGYGKAGNIGVQKEQKAQEVQKDSAGKTGNTKRA